MKKMFLAIFMALVAMSAQAIIYNLPNPILTPGAVSPDTKASVCSAKYTIAARHVTETTRKKVYAAYNTSPTTCEGGCKIDHLIPLAIGGSNDVKNLWPHAYKQDWSVYRKTRLEVKLRKDVCSGKTPIQEARTCIATNWIDCYQKNYPPAQWK